MAASICAVCRDATALSAALRPDRLGVLSALATACAAWDARRSELRAALATHDAGWLQQALLDASSATPTAREHGVKAVFAMAKGACDLEVLLPQLDESLAALAMDCRPWCRELVQLYIDRAPDGVARCAALLQGKLLQLVVKHRAHLTFFALYDKAPLALKADLLAELAPKLADVKRASPQLVHKTRLDLFCSAKTKWRADLDHAAKAQKNLKGLKGLIDTPLAAPQDEDAKRKRANAPDVKARVGKIARRSGTKLLAMAAADNAAPPKAPKQI